jgi:predicted AAA+ superfamily ATPase
VAELINVRDSKQFQLFLALCATLAGQLLNINSLAKDCGISQPTAKAWLSVLESSYLIFQLQPYHQNFSKRIIKTPKLYFYDTGLLAHLLKINSLEMALQSGTVGALFENLVIANAVKQNYHKALNREFWFWRDSNGKEIDLILQDSPKLNLYELKATSTISQKLFTNLNQFAKLAGAQIESKNLIYGGASNQKRNDVSVLAWHNL